MKNKGYQSLLFDSNINQSFYCPICSLVTKKPEQCKKCGLIYCQSCIKDKLCINNCDTVIQPLASKALLRIYKDLRIKCQKCQKIFEIEKIQQHRKICFQDKCFNHELCNNNGSIEYQSTCSLPCLMLYYAQNIQNENELYNKLKQLLQSLEKEKVFINQIQNNIIWSKKGDSIQIFNNGTAVFLKQSAYVFRTVITNKGFICGKHYWQIQADKRTQNQLKIGVTKDPQIDLNSAFCDHKTGWAFYGLAQLRHSSNASGNSYGKRFKKQGILGIFLDMDNGKLSFCLNNENFRVAFNSDQLKSGPIYPAISLLHCAGFKTNFNAQIPIFFR